MINQSEIWNCWLYLHCVLKCQIHVIYIASSGYFRRPLHPWKCNCVDQHPLPDGSSQSAEANVRAHQIDRHYRHAPLLVRLYFGMEKNKFRFKKRKFISRIKYLSNKYFTKSNGQIITQIAQIHESLIPIKM
jgi:hypothetical protein